MATITGTIFMRTREAPTSLLNGQNFISVSFFSVMFLFFNGQTELTIAVSHLHILPIGALLPAWLLRSHDKQLPCPAVRLDGYDSNVAFGASSVCVQIQIRLRMDCMPHLQFSEANITAESSAGEYASDILQLEVAQWCACPTVNSQNHR